MDCSALVDPSDIGTKQSWVRVERVVLIRLILRETTLMHVGSATLNAHAA